MFLLPSLYECRSCLLRYQNIFQHVCRVSVTALGLHFWRSWMFPSKENGEWKPLAESLVILRRMIIRNILICLILPQPDVSSMTMEYQFKTLMQNQWFLGRASVDLHQPQCSTRTYFIDSQRMKGKVDIGRSSKGNVRIDEMPVNFLRDNDSTSSPS